MNGRPRFLKMENQFFKALNNDFATRLSIPEAFIEEIQEELHGLAILQGPSGKCWPVNLNRTSKGTYLEGGWETFVKDHSLTEGAFLVFNHVGSMFFNVQILSRNACVQEGAFPFQASPELTCRQLKGKTQSPRGDAGNTTSTSKRKTVPTDFVRKHLPKVTKLMMLRDAEAREWLVKFCFCSPGHMARISVGWKRFASDNHIKEGDICAFELVEEDIFQVHIFRC